ncbi:MAG: putative immunity protein [Rhodococcus sp. (in: high G+C Gram-positive bacteria)]|uniref:putative immunity protein n=1 Tax=Rhodococcus sp. TaxID=1831 RepID=UPI003BAF3E6F
MADDSTTVELGRSELREVAGYAVACARPALAIFERERPGDRHPRAAIDAAQAFADGAERTKALRDSAWRHTGLLRRPAMQDRLRRATPHERPATRLLPDGVLMDEFRRP